LLKLLEQRTETSEDEAASTSVDQEERDFEEVAKESSKLRAVSLIHLIISCYDGTSNCEYLVNESMKAYSQALCFMDMVEYSSDPQAKLVSKAADREFRTLEKKWKKLLKIKQKKPGEENAKKLADEKMKKALEEEKMEQKSNEEIREGDIEGQRNPCIDKLHDSRDWMAEAAEANLDKTRNDMDIISSTSIQALRVLLAKVIFHCLENEFDKAVIRNCNKWAEDGKERKIYKAAFTAGKATGVRQQIKDKDAERVPAEGVEGER